MTPLYVGSPDISHKGNQKGRWPFSIYFHLFFHILEAKTVDHMLYTIRHGRWGIARTPAAARSAVGRLQTPVLRFTNITPVAKCSLSNDLWSPIISIAIQSSCRLGFFLSTFSCLYLLEMISLTSPVSVCMLLRNGRDAGRDLVFSIGPAYCSLLWSGTTRSTIL